MYTIDDNRHDIFEDDDYDYEGWNNRRSLIFKIIIIILCIIVLIWLIKALKTNRSSSDNGKIHASNTEKIRLAAEDYFFIKDHKGKVSYISLAGLKNEGLINDVVDANNKVCNDTNTKVNLEDDHDTYTMKIKFSCSTNDKDETFYYHKNTLACLNCDGKTNMTGRVVAKADEKETTSTTTTVTEIEEYEPEYSCTTWSTWSKDRVYDNSLTERTKTLVTGVKYGSKTVYGEWSNYTTTPILNNDGVEIETKVVSEQVWSGNKTARNIDTTNNNIRVISTETVSGKTKNSCKNGYVEDGICYSNNVTVSNLTYSEYVSGEYNIKKENCEGAKTMKDKNGLYVLTYLDCQYNEKIGTATTSNSSSYTVYTYQELETKDVTYYRYRIVRDVNEPNEYTNSKYEEKDLPSGFVKLDGSEETYYSYKLSECVK